jgi:hypothetical protein
MTRARRRARDGKQLQSKPRQPPSICHLRTELPAAHRAADDRRRQAAALQQHIEQRRATTHAAACEAFLPFVVVSSRYWAHRWNMPDAVDDFIQDASFGLIRLLDLIANGRWRCCGLVHFRTALVTSIYLAIKGGRDARTWGGFSRTSRQRLVQNFQQRYRRAHGRSAPPRLVAQFIASQVDNPNFVNAHRDRRQMERQCDVAASDEQWAVMVDRRPDLGATPDEIAWQGELMRIARRSLKGVDRKIFTMLMRGESYGAIAKAVKLSRRTMDVRANGLLWSLRCRADLAAALGVEPSNSADVPRCRGDSGRAHAYAKSIKSAPPVRRVA